KIEVKRRRGQQLETAFTAEASEISTDALDPALFDLPADYREVSALNAANCSGTPEPIAHLEDGTSVYRVGCGIKPPAYPTTGAGIFGMRSKEAHLGFRTAF